MHIRLLHETDIDDVVTTFQRAFADYIVKVQLDHDALMHMMQRRGADLSVSAGAFVDGQMKAVMVVALGELEAVYSAYDVFTGVVPDARGQGLAARLFEAAVPACVTRGATRFVLEVIEDNKPAVRAYRKIGFRERRRLRIFAFEHRLTSPSGVKVTMTSVDDALVTLRTRSAVPSWQNSDASIRRAGDAVMALRAEQSGRSMGSIFCVPATADVPQVHVEAGQARVLQALLAAAQSKIEVDGPIRLVNVDASAKWLCDTLLDLGATERQGQFEMEWSLPAETP